MQLEQSTVVALAIFLLVQTGTLVWWAATVTMTLRNLGEKMDGKFKSRDDDMLRLERDVSRLRGQVQALRDVLLRKGCEIDPRETM